LIAFALMALASLATALAPSVLALPVLASSVFALTFPALTFSALAAPVPFARCEIGDRRLLVLADQHFCTIGKVGKSGGHHAIGS
jgi:hypothetical protein